jgi:DNA-binding NtrC family response regulator
MSETRPLRLLIVEYQPELRELCARLAARLGLECIEADTAEAALAAAEREVPDMILSDLALGRISGLELLATVKQRWPQVDMALMSGHANVELVVEGMRLGAFDFAVKPIQVDRLLLLFESMAQNVRRRRAAYREQMEAANRGSWPADCTDLEELERLTVLRVFEQVKGDKVEAQRRLGISRATLYRKIKRYGIRTVFEA